MQGGVGYFSVIASKLVGEEGKVFVFEPDRRYIPFLRSNIAINNCKNVILVNKAVSNENKNSILYQGKTLGENRIAEIWNGEGAKSQEIKLDDFYGERVDFVKMDIEGAEIKALKGMNRLLKENRNIKMILETSPELIEFLKENNFKISRLKDNKNLFVNFQLK